MKVFKFLLIPLCMLLTSMFYFPFEFRALPTLNTKKILAATALVILLFKMVGKHELKMDKSFLYISILAGLVSFCGMISVTYNSTEDYAYATYITSCWVWWGAAYTVCQFIKWIHRKITAWHIMGYLTAVGVFQCGIALAIDRYPAVKNYINSIVLQEDLLFPGHIRRLYGIGASLDVAGIRFSAILILILFLLIQSGSSRRWYTYVICLSSFVFIVVVGNMIARTTLVGLLLSVAYLLYRTFTKNENTGLDYKKIWAWLGTFSLLAVPVCIWFYQNNTVFHEDLRFAFEGFFNWAENGTLSYSSNETLKDMYVLPKQMKTWIIGDGYFSNPVDVDPYFTGKVIGGYYMGTDIGYLRFLFYFGLIGLLMFSFYFIEVGRTCMKFFPEWKPLFVFFVALNFIVWLKVATDVFLIFALFLCLGTENADLNADLNANLNEKLDKY